MYPKILVTVQFSTLFLLALTHPHLPQTLMGQFSLITGIIIGLWAIVAMRRSVLKISPTVDPKAILVTSGPYRFIRHPMYTAVLLVAFSLLWEQPTLLRLSVFIILLADLLLKIDYEESLLQSSFKPYQDYSRQTAKLIPWLF